MYSAISAVLLLTVIFLILIFYKRSVTDDSYIIKTPSVLQFGAISASDFIEIKPGYKSFTAEFVSLPQTAVSGIYTATLHVTEVGGDRNGYDKTIECAYSVLPLISDEVIIEAGETVTPKLFINRQTPGAAEAYDYEIENPLNTSEVGDFEVTLYAGGNQITAAYTVIDTTPPVATGINLLILNDSGTPKPSDFITGLDDATEVSVTFAEVYDFERPGKFYVTLILRDAAGNTSEVTAFADCRVDVEAPVITGLDDIFVIVGGAVSYKDGVTVTDNSGCEPELSVDASAVDTRTRGIYEVVYSAVDGAGNITTQARRVCVVDKLPPAEEEVMALARSVYDEKIITREDMSLWDIAYAIYKWTYNNIRFHGTGIDKSSWLTAAYDGFNTHRGDCFTYMAVTRALLDCAGIENMEVHRLRYEGESSHYWLLVDIGDGWYHLDSCWHTLAGPSFETFMRTDAELLYYGQTYNVEHYYRFDHDAYPARGTDSYYD